MAPVLLTAPLYGIVSLLLSTAISSCSPIVYSTTGQNVPLFREKGEFTASAAYAMSEDASGVELQGAAALTNHFGVLASFYALSNSLREYEEGWGGKGNYTELAAGYFDALGPNRFFLYEIYGGVGLGNIRCDANDRSVLNSRYVKPFLQPSLGFRGRVAELALTARIGVLHYTGYTASLTEPERQAHAVAFFDRRKNSALFEPGLTFRIGFQQVKLQVQYTLSTFNGDRDGSGYTVSNQEYLSLGIRCMLSQNWPHRPTRK